MPLNIYLNFDGNCREAAEFYADVFKAQKPKIMTFADNKADFDVPLPDEAKARVLHAELSIGGSVVMLSDIFPGMPFTVGNNVSLTYTSGDRSEIEAIFGRLQEGGSVGMELQETFWSKCYGMVTDKYGVAWMLSMSA